MVRPVFMHKDGSVPSFVSMDVDMLTLLARERSYQYRHVTSAVWSDRTQRQALLRATEGVVTGASTIMWRARWVRAAVEEHVECEMETHPRTPLALLRRFFDSPLGLGAVRWCRRGRGAMQPHVAYDSATGVARAWMYLDHPAMWCGGDPVVRAACEALAPPSQAAARVHPDTAWIDVVVTGFLPTYRALMTRTWMPEALAVPVDAARLNVATLRAFAIPFPRHPHVETWRDACDWIRAGYSVAATLLYRLCVLHVERERLAQLNAPCLDHVLQLLIDAHMPLLAMMVKWGRWSDAECAGAPLEIPLEARDRVTSRPLRMHPAAPDRLRERNRAFYDHATQRADPTPPCTVAADEWPTHLHMLELWWPLSTDVLTLEAVPSLTPILFNTSLMGDVERRRSVQTYAEAVHHLLLSKVAPHKCMMRGAKRIATTYMETMPHVARTCASYFMTSALGNIPGNVERPRMAQRVRMWLWATTESVARRPSAWDCMFEYTPIKPTQRRDLLMRDIEHTLRHETSSAFLMTRVTLREILATFMQLNPTFGCTSRYRNGKLDMWRASMQQVACAWRRRMDAMPAVVPHDRRMPAHVWARAMAMHISETNTIIQRSMDMAGQYTNIITRPGGFVGMMWEMINKFYHEVERPASGRARAGAPSSTTTTAPGNNNRRMLEVVDCYERQAKLREIAGQYPKAYDPGIMRYVTWKMVLQNPSLIRVKHYMLAYFGVVPFVIEQLRVWQIYYERHDVATNWFKHRVKALWQRYPQSFCVLWAFYGYLKAHREEIPVMLPRDMALHQYKARMYAMQCSPDTRMGDVPLSYDHVSTFCACAVCKRWSHTIAAESRLDMVYDEKEGRCVDPVELAARNVVEKHRHSPVPDKRTLKRKRALDDQSTPAPGLGATDSLDDLEALLDAALALEHKRHTDDDEQDEGEEDEDDDDAAVGPAALPAPKRPVRALGLMGPTPSQRIDTGTGASVGIHTLSQRSTGSAVNGTGVGVSNETSGLFQTDFVSVQYDPVRNLLLCSNDTSKRAGMREMRMLFESATVVHSREHAARLMAGTAQTYVPQSARRVTFASLPTDAARPEATAEPDVSEYVTLDSPACTYSATVRHLMRATENTHAAAATRQQLLDAIHVDADELADAQESELLEMLDRTAHRDLGLLSSSVTRARRCSVPVTSYHVIGYMRMMNGLAYTACGLCGSLVPARDRYLNPVYGYTCPRHGLTNNGFEMHSGTFIPSPFIRPAQLQLSKMIMPGWIRLQPQYMITQRAQLLGIPRVWFLKYGVDRFEQACELWRAGTPEGRVLLRALQRSDAETASEAVQHVDLYMSRDQSSPQGAVLGRQLWQRCDPRVPRSYICDRCFQRSPQHSVVVETHLSLTLDLKAWRWRSTCLCTRHWNEVHRTHAKSKHGAAASSSHHRPETVAPVAATTLPT